MPVRVSPAWVNSKVGLPLPASRTTSKLHFPEMSAAKVSAASAKNRTRVFMRAMISLDVLGGLGQDGGGLLTVPGIDVLSTGPVPRIESRLRVIARILPMPQSAIRIRQSVI